MPVDKAIQDAISGLQAALQPLPPDCVMYSDGKLWVAVDPSRRHLVGQIPPTFGGLKVEVSSWSPAELGAFLHKMETAVSQPSVITQLHQATKVIQVAADATKIIQDMKVSMNNRLAEKLKSVASASSDIATKIEGRCDAFLARKAALEKKTDETFAPHEAILTQAESGLGDIEKALALLSNGGPPLDGSGT